MFSNSEKQYTYIPSRDSFMKDKAAFYLAMKKNQGHLDEISLGEKFGFDEHTVQRMINALLAEYKIEYFPIGACNYFVKSKKKSDYEY